MIVVLSTSIICNFGGGIVDISMDLCGNHIALRLYQDILSMVEEAHGWQQLSRVKAMKVRGRSIWSGSLPPARDGIEHSLESHG